MARPKEFEPDIVLKKAITLFAEHGYAGTSTESLLRAMGISRQSMYDTFGDKWALYLAALRRYNDQSVGELVANLDAGASPMDGLETALLAFAGQAKPGAPVTCLGVSAVCEFGRSDEEVAGVTEASGKRVLAAFERLIAKAKAAGEAAADIEPAKAARFMLSTVTGMKVSARAGADPDTLRDIARMAIRSLR